MKQLKEHSVLIAIIAKRDLVLAILNGLTSEFKQAVDDERKTMFKEAIADVLRSLVHYDFDIHTEPFNTYAQLIGYDNK